MRPLVAPTYASFSSQCHFPSVWGFSLLIYNCFHHSVSDTHIRPNTRTNVHRAITADGSRCEMTPHCRRACLFANFKSNTFCIWRGKLIGFHVSHPSTPWLSSVTSRTPSLQPDMLWHLLKSKWRKWEVLVTSNSPPASLSSFSVNHPRTHVWQILTKVLLLHSHYFTIRHLRGIKRRKKS